MKDSIPLLIDTDPGVDDALALLMAFNSPRHRLLGLCIAAGNVGLDYTTANALKLCEVAGVTVPVYPGCDRPLVFAAEDASYVHGRDGFGDIGYEPSQQRPESEHAALPFCVNHMPIQVSCCWLCSDRLPIWPLRSDSIRVCRPGSAVWW